MKSHPVWIVVPALAISVALAYPMPQGSQARASRHQAWREALERGEQALDDGRRAEAEAAFEQVIDESRSFHEPGLLLARALDRMGDLRRVGARWIEAEAFYVEAVELWQRFLGPGQPRLAVTLQNLGMVYAEQGRVEEARASLTRALEILEHALGEGSSEVERARQALLAVEQRGNRAGSPP